MIFIIAYSILALFLICTILEIIFIKLNKQKQSKIVSIFPLPLLIASLVLLFIPKLPDSKNLLFSTIGSFTFIYLAYLKTVFTNFIVKTEKHNKIFTISAFLLSNIFWFIILKPSFKLIDLSLFSILLLICIYTALSFFIVKIINKSFDNKTVLLITIFLFPQIIINLSSIITVILQPRFYSTLFLLTSFLLIFISINKIKELYANKNSVLVNTILFLIFELLYAASSVLMIY